MQKKQLKNSRKSIDENGGHGVARARRRNVLTERFVGPYRVKEIVSSNTVKLELPSTVKIHLVVNISRVRQYVGQVEEQRKKQLALVIIKGEEKWEVE